MHTVLRSASKAVLIGPDQPFCIIGERINPTGRTTFAEQLRAGDLSQVIADVDEQVAGGAHVLDVNMGVPLTDEAALLAQAVAHVQDHTDLPICIDSSVVEALEAGLAAYEGKASSTRSRARRRWNESCRSSKTTVRRSSASSTTKPDSADRRGAARRLQADRRRSPRSLGDSDGGHRGRPSAMTVGADPAAVVTTLETIRLVKAEFV
jgi:5-methyltetrahydrofolate--homocysteine methyltransferase